MNIRSLDIKANSIDDLISELKSGFSADSFDRLKNLLKISDNMLSKIVHIPQRTLTRRRQDGRLRPDESERVLRIAKIYDKALEVFETEIATENWLKKPSRGLGYKVPLEYADTEPGAQEVLKLLGRMEHGIFPG